MSRLSRYDFLKSRGWKRSNRFFWIKRGWEFSIEEACKFENYMEHMNGAVVPRDSVSAALLSRIRKYMQYEPVWGLQ